MTFDEAVGRIFAFKDRRLYVVRAMSMVQRALVIDLETSQEILMWHTMLWETIPREWKEILP